LSRFQRFDVQRDSSLVAQDNAAGFGGTNRARNYPTRNRFGIGPLLAEIATGLRRRRATLADNSSSESFCRRPNFEYYPPDLLVEFVLLLLSAA